MDKRLGVRLCLHSVLLVCAVAGSAQGAQHARGFLADMDLAGVGALLSGGAAVGQLLAGGGGGNRRLSQAQGYQNMHLQNEAFYNFIQRRVSDAKAAGIHPLYALGASPQFSPVSVDYYPDSDSGRWEALGAAGRAAERYASARQGRRSEKLRDELLRAEIQKTKTETGAIAARSAAALATQPAVQTGPPGPPDMYIRVHDNLSNQDVWLPNPELNLEMPETVGAGYWAYGKAHDKRLRKEASAQAGRDVAKGFRYDSGPCKGMTARECSKAKGRSPATGRFERRF